MEDYFLRPDTDNGTTKRKRKKEKNHMEEINNQIIQESFPEFKDTSPQMKREYQVLRAMS